MRPDRSNAVADEVASLYATLGAKVDASSWARADAVLQRAQKAAQRFARVSVEDPARAARATSLAASTAAKSASAEAKREAEKVADAHARAAAKSRAAYMGLGFAVRAAAVGMAGYLGSRLVKSGIQFNATMEESRLKIAGMLALTNHSSLSSELGTADTLVANLQRRAATLPGTTSEYIAMLGMLAQPLSDAKLGIQDMEDMTVNSVVAAKALGIQWEVAARDVDQAVRGQFHSVDPFSGKVLGSIGYKGEEGRSRFNQLSQQKRALEIKRALMQPQFTELGAEQGKAFSGRLSTLQDTWEQFKGKVTKPLFTVLGEQIMKANAWLDANQAKVAAAANAIGGALVDAFHAAQAGAAFLVDAYFMLRDALDVVSAKLAWFTEHATFTRSLLISMGIVATYFGIRAMWAGRQAAIAFTLAAARAAVAWVAVAGPIGLAIAALTGAVYVVLKYWDEIKEGGAAVAEVLAGVFGGIRDFALDVGRRIAKFFTEDLPGAIKAAFEFIANLPVLKQVIDVIHEARSLMGKSAFQEAADKAMAAQNAQAAISLSGGVLGRSSTVNVGGMTLNVSSTSADPKAVAMEATKAVREELGTMLRRTMDTLA